MKNPKPNPPAGGQDPKLTMVTAMSPLVRQSARKVRLVVDAINAMNPHDATQILQFVKKRASDPVRQTIMQALANVTKNMNISDKSIKKMHLEVLEMPTMKRFRIGGRGRIKPVLKRASRIVVKLFVEKGEA